MTTTAPRVLRVATRGSPLALIQTARVVELISGLPGSPRCEAVVVRTSGDRTPEVPIERLGARGAFVKEVSAAVADGRADIAVHSAKDMSSTSEPGLVLAAVPERIDPRDAMVGKGLEDLGPGDRVATGSARRRAQLAWLRPDLSFSELRGNMASRVEAAERVGAGVLAVAALERLGLRSRVASVLDPGTMLPQVGQGALAVECRSSDTVVIEMLGKIDDVIAHAALNAERAFLAALGGGCSLPCGALATPWSSSPRAGDAQRGDAQVAVQELELHGMLAGRDGHVLLRHTCVGDEPFELGSRLAEEMLDLAGGRAIVDWSAN